MSVTSFWLVRHAVVEAGARAVLYGTMDVSLCPISLPEQAPIYRALAARLPRPATWIVTPLSRTKRTAEAIFAAGYPTVTPLVEPALIEHSLGDWHGLAHAELPPRLTHPAHPFWPLAGTERPPRGESVADMFARVGPAMDRLARDHAGEDVVIIGHGGAIRAALAHALRIEADSALHFAIANLSLTRLEHEEKGWRVLGVNELPGF